MCHTNGIKIIRNDTYLNFRFDKSLYSSQTFIGKYVLEVKLSGTLNLAT